jgi:hypothetical protein
MLQSMQFMSNIEFIHRLPFMQIGKVLYNREYETQLTAETFQTKLPCRNIYSWNIPLRFFFAKHRALQLRMRVFFETRYRLLFSEFRIRMSGGISLDQLFAFPGLDKILGGEINLKVWYKIRLYSIQSPEV